MVTKSYLDCLEKKLKLCIQHIIHTHIIKEQKRKKQPLSPNFGQICPYLYIFKYLKFVLICIFLSISQIFF